MRLDYNLTCDRVNGRNLRVQKQVVESVSAIEGILTLLDAA